MLSLVKNEQKSRAFTCDQGRATSRLLDLSGSQVFIPAEERESILGFSLLFFVMLATQVKLASVTCRGKHKAIEATLRGG